MIRSTAYACSCIQTALTEATGQFSTFGRSMMPRLLFSQPSQFGMTLDFIPEQAPHDLVGCRPRKTVAPHHL